MAQYPSKAADGAHQGREKLFTRNFLLACFITLTAFGSFYLLLATLPVYIVNIGGSESEVGLIIAVFSLTTVFLRPFIGRAADSYGKRIFILIGNAILALASGTYGLARTVPLLLGLRVFHGVGWAAGGTATSALVADIAPPTRRGEAMGYFGMFNNLAMAVGPAFGFLLLNNYGFSTLFFTSAAIGVLATLLVLPVREARHNNPGAPSPGASGPQSRPQGPSLAGSPAARSLGGGDLIERTALFPSAVLVLMSVTYGTIVTFLSVFADKQGIENPGIFFTVYAIVLIIARGLTGQLSDRYGRPAVIAPGLVLAAVGLLLLSTATALPTFLGVAVLYGLSFAAVQPAIMAMVVDRAPAWRRGAAMGTFSTAMDLGIGGGALVGGFVAQAAGYPAMYAAAAGVALLALVVLLVGTRGTRQAVPEG
ncbi:MAG: MFS transporter [Dehalococcoidales bacterium]|nr:MFS transporter [Dehalococcoidales bacterium]